MGGKRKPVVVTFATAQQASKAIKTLNKTTIPGNQRYIDVEIDDPDKREGWKKEKNQKRQQRKKAAKAAKNAGGENLMQTTGVKNDKLKKKKNKGSGGGNATGGGGGKGCGKNDMMKMMMNMMAMMGGG